MRPIIIGAGRGSRLGAKTEHLPKTLVEVMGKPMLEWVLEALESAGFSRRDVIFICGYAEERIRERYPEFTYVRNADWEKNNILLSLLCAREHLKDGFVSTYSDIVYEGLIVQKLVAAPEPIVLGCDTHWRRRYVERFQHPETDAEKLVADGRRVTEISRHIPSERASGEFIGVMKLTPDGARDFLAHFERARGEFSGRIYREGRTFEKAYLIDLLAEMLERGSSLHREDTLGGYMELDTLEDLSHAQKWWNEKNSC